MVYGLINEVRTLAGIKPVYAHGIELIDGNGIRTEFKVPSVGHNKGFFVDINSSTTSTITVDDIVVYVDGTPVTISSFDQNAGTVTLTSPPANNTTVTIDYQYSRVSDADVIKAMDIGAEIVDVILRSGNATGSTYTQLEDGDGKRTRFELDHDLVASVDTVTLNGTTQTEGSEYYVYKYKGTDDIWYIEFVSPPSTDYQNVSIVYTYGRLQALATKLSNLYSARHLINSGQIDNKDNDGEWVAGDGYYDQRVDVSRLGLINREIISTQSLIDGRKKYESV